MAPVSRPIVSIFSACFNARSRASCAAASSGIIGHLIRAARRRRQAECARIGGPGAQGTTMPPRPYILNELTWKTVRDTRYDRSEEHTSELQSQSNLVCRLLLEKKKLTNLLLYRYIQ